jgi:predicted double-glycine peptidase
MGSIEGKVVALEHYTNLMNATHDLIVTFDNAASNHIDVVNRIDVLRVMLAQARQIKKEAQSNAKTTPAAD